MKLGVNKNTIKNTPKAIFGKRRFILVVLFLLLSVYVFSVIYENAYLNLAYISDSNAINFLDGKKENEMIKKLTEDLKNRKERIQSGKLEKHKNYFSYEKETKTDSKENIKNNCYDCGESGWQIMDEKCEQAILGSDDLQNCLMNFNWLSTNQSVGAEEIKDGYIEVGSMETFNGPTEKSIKVFIYHQWAADKDGNLYLLGQLG